MSSRMLKKVFGSTDEALKVEPASEDEEPVFGGGAKRNTYALLNELSESEGRDEDGQEDGDDEQKTGDSSKVEDDTSQCTSLKKKKRRKKPGKGKKKYGNSSADTEATEDEEILRQKQKANRTIKIAHAKEREPPITAKYEELFKIDSRLLNPEFELKRIFGAKVINSERGKQGQRRVYKHSKLIAPKEGWPNVAGSGISMSYMDTIDGFMYFKFEHNSGYQEIQKQFMRAVESLNPDNIVTIMKIDPYHIDSHIQLSDMAKAAEDMQVAAELIEGALHCLESTFHTRFLVSSPLCRLTYKYQENRPFFILLFKHLIFVGQRACHRTALELCKRLLCLDPEIDPLCASLMLDFYAIKSGEYQWLIDFYSSWEKTKNFSQLPNYAYSVALAYHFLAVQQPQKKEGKEKENTHIPLTPLLSPEELANKSDSMIQYALMMFPSVLLPLLEKCSVQCDARAKGHHYFNATCQNSQTRALKLLYEMYVWRAHHVWREPSILGWLEKNVNIVLDKVDANDPIVKDFDAKRRRRYHGTPQNVLRHVILTDNKELTVNLNPELSKEPIMNYDPLPPPDAVDIYSWKDRNLRGSSSTSGRQNGLFSMLFRSLIYDLNAPEALNDPNNPVPNLVPLEMQDEGAVGENPAIAVGAGLQQSVTALLDAMRDLLTNANPRGGSEVADGEEESEGEET